MKNEGELICSKCGKATECVYGKVWIPSSGKLPEAIGPPEGKIVIWDNVSYIHFPECGNRIRV